MRFLIVFTLLVVSSSVIKSQSDKSSKIGVHLGPTIGLTGSTYQHQLEIVDSKIYSPSLGFQASASLSLTDKSSLHLTLGSLFFSMKKNSSNDNFIPETNLLLNERRRVLKISGVMSEISLTYSSNLRNDKIIPFVGVGISKNISIKAEEELEGIDYYSIVLNPNIFNPDRYRELSTPSELERERSMTLKNNNPMGFVIIGIRSMLGPSTIAMISGNKYFSKDSEIYSNNLDLRLSLLFSL